MAEKGVIDTNSDEGSDSSDFLATDKKSTFTDDGSESAAPNKGDSKEDKALNEAGSGEDMSSRGSIHMGSEEKLSVESLAEEGATFTGTDLGINIATDTETQEQAGLENSEESATQDIELAQVSEEETNQNEVSLEEQGLDTNNETSLNDVNISAEAAEIPPIPREDNIGNEGNRRSIDETAEVENVEVVAATSEDSAPAESSINQEEVIVESAPEELPPLPGEVSLEVENVSANEDSVISLDINTSFENIADEDITIIIKNVPDGASLSRGIDNGDGSYTLTLADLEGLTLTPAANSSDDFNLEITIEGLDADGSLVSATSDLSIDLQAIADSPELNMSDASGNEDSAIALNISSSLTDLDGSESLEIIITGVPEGALLSAGTDNGDGSWTLSGEDLDGLTITPAENSDADFTLTVTATATDGSDTSSVSGTISVDVDAVADTPTLVLNNASGSEDSAIALDISSGLTDLDGSETLSIVIDGVPVGALLSAGTDNGDGSWTLSGEDLDGLTITPAENSDADFTLTVTATSTDGSDSTSVTGSINVNVDAVADTPTLVLNDASGSEDSAIALDISSGLTDLDGSETLSIVIDGVPVGALLSAGTDNGDGSWTLSGEDLDGLTITPAENSDADFTLTVTATSTDGSDSTSVTGSINVNVDAVADTPTLVLNDASGNEDSAIALDISSGLTDLDGSETLSIVIAGVPDGATLSAGTDNGDGTWTLSGEDLDGLTITPPENSDADFTLTVTATSTDGSDSTSVTGSINVNVDAVADTPTLVLNDASGSEDSAIALDISSGLTDLDGSETLSIVIDGVPVGALLSAGTDNGDGSWTLSGEDLDGLTITPAENSDADFTLTVTATSTDGSDSTSVTGSINVNVDAVADTPTLVLNDASGSEDSAIALDISSGLTDLDGSETLSIVIDGVPVGALLSAGTDNGDGSWTLSGEDLDGLTITPAENSDENFTLTVTATATDGSDTSSVSGTISVDVDAVADTPTLVLNDASGSEDSAIALDISSGLTDLDGSETLSIVIDGVPVGALLSAGTDNGDGSWTLSGEDLDGLTITPAENSDADFTLTVTATATDGSDTSSVSGTISVDVDAVADTPTLVLNNASGSEDSAIALDISSGLTDLDGSETLSIVIDGVPVGALLSAGTDNGDGSWTLSGEDLDGLTITPAENSDADFTLTVTATATDGSDSTSVTGSINVNVDAVADTPTLVLNDASGSEDSAIALDISSGLTDLDGSETLSIVIDGVPVGALLSAGTDNGDGSWTLSGEDLDGLTITPAENSDADFTLTVTATATDGSDTSSVSGTISVDVDAVADTPTLVLNDASGNEDSAIALDISSGLTDLDGSETLSIVIDGVPVGALLSAGTDNGDGSWTLSGEDLDGLTVTPAENSDENFTLTVTATATDGSDTSSVSGTISVDVDAVADAPTLTLNDASGREDTAIALDITSSLSDLDGSESLEITIGNVPDGASLSAGTDNGDGTWTLSSADLDGLTITPAQDDSTDFTLSVSATATESNGDKNTVTSDLNVTVEAYTPPSVEFKTVDLVGNENQNIDLPIDIDLSGGDGTEMYTIEIDGLPPGFELSAGTSGGDNVWTVSAEDLEGLQIIPKNNTEKDFTIEVNVTVTDADGNTQDHNTTFDVNMNPEGQIISTDEDTPASINVSDWVDTGDASHVVLSGFPEGTTFDVGTDNGDGTWTVDSADFDNITMTPPENDSTDFTLSMETFKELNNGKFRSIDSEDITVDIEPVADAASLEVHDVTGNAGEMVDLDISSILGDTDGSEELSLTLSGLSEGVTLSAGIDNGDGTWTLDSDDLEGLQASLPEDLDTDFTVHVESTSEEFANNDSMTVSDDFAVHVVPTEENAS